MGNTSNKQNTQANMNANQEPAMANKEPIAANQEPVVAAKSEEKEPVVAAMPSHPVGAVGTVAATNEEILSLDLPKAEMATLLNAKVSFEQAKEFAGKFNFAKMNAMYSSDIAAANALPDVKSVAVDADEDIAGNLTKDLLASGQFTKI